MLGALSQAEGHGITRATGQKRYQEPFPNASRHWARRSPEKDFGYGYKYDVILEDAQVTLE